MSDMTRNEAQLLLSGIRVLSHLQEQPPTPEQLAELLQMSASFVRLRLSVLKEMGVVALVESAYEVHCEIRDHLPVQELPEEAGPAISEDLREFDRRKQEETERMSRLFDSGEHEEQRKKKLQQMDQELQGFRKEKPRNPFGDD